jgi:hypothetical protein
MPRASLPALIKAFKMQAPEVLRLSTKSQMALSVADAKSLLSVLKRSSITAF